MGMTGNCLHISTVEPTCFTTALILSHRPTSRKKESANENASNMSKKVDTQ